MRYRTPFLFVLGFFLTVIAAMPVLPAEARRLCYCRLTNHANLGAGDEQKFCRDEVVVVGSVGDSITASIDCRAMCESDGHTYVDESSVGPDVGTYDIALNEREQCVFSRNAHGSTDPNPVTGWTNNYNDCRAPLNSIPNVYNRNGIVPDTCSYCFCKYGAGGGVSASCTGKTVFMHATSAPELCPRFCEDIGMESAGNAVRNFNDQCDYKTTNDCATPASSGGACGNEAGERAREQALHEFQANRGSVLGQLLPLGDISLPQAIARLIQRLLSVVGAIALVFFIWGGIKYMTAAGDDKKVGEARNMLTTTVTAMAAIFLSYALLSLLINALT